MDKRAAEMIKDLLDHAIFDGWLQNVWESIILVPFPDLSSVNISCNEDGTLDKYYIKITADKQADKFICANTFIAGVVAAWLIQTINLEMGTNFRNQNHQFRQLEKEKAIVLY